MSFIEFKDVKKIYQLGEIEIKALDGVSFDIDKVTVLGGIGAAFNGLESGNVALVTEADVSYYFTDSFALGASFDCAFGVREFASGVLKEVEADFVPAGKVFLTYSF